MSQRSIRKRWLSALLAAAMVVSLMPVPAARAVEDAPASQAESASDDGDSVSVDGTSTSNDGDSASVDGTNASDDGDSVSVDGTGASDDGDNASDDGTTAAEASDTDAPSTDADPSDEDPSDTDPSDEGAASEDAGDPLSDDIGPVEADAPLADADGDPSDVPSDVDAPSADEDTSTDTEDPSDTEIPSTDEDPSDTEVPSADEDASDTEAPSADEDTSDTEIPSVDEEPSDADDPSVDENTSDTDAPSADEEPSEDEDGPFAEDEPFAEEAEAPARDVEELLDALEQDQDAVAEGDILASGTCGAEGDGSNVTWTLTSDGVLTISGNGPMADYDWMYYLESDEDTIRPPWFPWDLTDYTEYARAPSEARARYAEEMIAYIEGTGPEPDVNVLNSILDRDFMEYLSEKYSWTPDRIKSVVIEEGVTRIGNEAFCKSCYGNAMITISITSVTLPESLTSIGDYAFRHCPLETVRIPSGVTEIGDDAFSAYPSAGEVRASYAQWMVDYIQGEDIDGLTEIVVDPDNAYYTSVDGVLYTKDMTELLCYPIGKRESAFTVPETVTSIGGGAFAGCSALTEIGFPSGLRTIGSAAFIGTALTEISLPTGLREIGPAAFCGCMGLTEIVVPDGVESIGAFAFCEGRPQTVTTVSLPDGLVSIGENAFSGRQLAGIDLPDSLTEIGAGAFSGCGLTSVTLPKSLRTIGDGAFGGCGAIGDDTDAMRSLYAQAMVLYMQGDSMDLPANGLTDIEVDPDNAWYTSVDGVLYTKDQTELLLYPSGRDASTFTVPETVASIDSGVFAGCEALTEIVLPDGLRTIGSAAFAGCKSLTGITLPDSLRTIGSGAFMGCDSLTEITVPGGVESVGDWAFSMCDSLEVLRIEEGVGSIGDLAFCGATIGTLYYPASAVDLGELAFDMTKIQKIEFSGDEDQWTAVVGDGTTMGYLNNYPSKARLTTRAVVTYDADGGSGTMDPVIVEKTSDWSPSGSNATILSGGIYVSGATLESGETAGSAVIVKGVTLSSDGLGDIETIPSSGSDMDLPFTLTFTFDDDGHVLSSGGTTSAASGTGSDTGSETGSGTGSATPAASAEADPDPDGSYVLPSCGFTPPSGRPFQGWQVGSDGTVRQPGDTVSVTTDTVVKAVWEAAQGYTVTFDANGGTGIMSDGTAPITSEDEGTASYTLPSCGFTAPDGREFYGWQVGSDGTVRQSGDSVTVTADTVVTALWRKSDIRVRFDANGGSGSMGSTGVIWKYWPEGYFLPVCGFTPPEGMRFRAWEIDGVEYRPGAIVPLTDDVTAKAVWEDASEPRYDRFGSEIVEEGDCGYAVTWTLDKDGIFLISGRGPMTDYTMTSTPPWIAVGTGDKWCQRAIREIVIDEGVTTIGSWAFLGCYSLTKVTIPEGVVRIGESAFIQCHSLTDVTIPSSVKEIAKWAFFQCGMSQMVIPEGVEVIGDQAFNVSTNLTEVYLPASLVAAQAPFFHSPLPMDVYYAGTEEQWAELDERHRVDGQVYGPISLEKDMTLHYVTASGTCGERVSWALDEDGILHIVGRGPMDDGAPWSAYADDIRAVEVSTFVTSIGAGAFAGLTAVESIVLPMDLTTIGAGAFPETGARIQSQGSAAQWDAVEIGADNAGLDGVEMGETFYADRWILRPDGTITFYGDARPDVEGTEWTGDLRALADRIRAVRILPGTEEAAGYAVFQIQAESSCEYVNVERACLPASVTSIFRTAFQYCSKLTDVYFGGTAEQWASLIGAVPDRYDGEHPLSCADVHFVHYVTFDAAGGTGSMDFEVLPDGESCVLPENGFTAPDGKDFQSWRIGTRMYRSGESVRVESDMVFQAVWARDGVVEHVVTFDTGGAGTMDPVTVTMGDDGTASYVLPEWTLEIPAGKSFRGWRIGGTQYLPGESVAVIGDITVQAVWIDLYTAFGICGAEGHEEDVIWTLSDGILTISGAGPMADYPPVSDYSDDIPPRPWDEWSGQIRAVVIGPGVSSIGVQAFRGSTALRSVEISGSVQEIGRCAFLKCAALESVEIPGSVRSIGQSAFYNCRALGSVTIHEGVQEIGWAAFGYCVALGPVEIPGSVRSIGWNSFTACAALESVTIHEGVQEIGQGAFSHDPALRSVTIPESVGTIGSRAFDRCPALQDVWYGGSASEWAAIETGSDNDPLLSAAIHYGAYDITFDPDGGSGSMDPVVLKIVSDDGVVSYTLPSCGFTAPDGMVFAGWQIGDDEAVRQPGETVQIGTDTVVRAVWTAERTAWQELQDALTAGGTDGVVTLTKDVTASADDTYLTIPAGVEVTLDLDGHKIDRALTEAVTGGCVIRVSKDASLTVKDSSATDGDGGTGAITGGYNSGGGGVVVDGGTFVLTGGAVSGNTASGNGGGVIVNSGTFGMSGGRISGNTAKDGGGVFVIDGVSTMEGGTVSGNTAESGGGVVVYGTFVMKGGRISGNTAFLSGGGVDVAYHGTFLMSGGQISGNTSTSTYSNGGGVYVSGGTFRMEDGTVSGNTAESGGGVYVSGGTSTMTGGQISGNSAKDGGGVYINKGTFALEDGQIVRNRASRAGGGVDTYDTFDMSGGQISGSTAEDGGGVYVSGGTSTMTGGQISGNSATSLGGGVYIYATFDMSGGQISGNSVPYYGGGVYVYGVGSGASRISGTAKITGNVSGGTIDSDGVLSGGTANDAYLPTGRTITVAGALSDEASIGVTVRPAPTEGSPVTITSGLSGNGTAAAFFSDDEAYTVGVSAEGEAVLRLPSAAYTVAFDPDGGSGTMDPVALTIVSDDGVVSYTLPDCGFDAPSGKRFQAWSVDGVSYAPGAQIEISGDTVVRALWEDWISAELVSATANVIAITVTWQAADGISTYRVLRKTADTSWTTLADVTGTSYTDPVTRKDVEYTYTVQCLDGGTVTGSYDTKGITATRTGGYDYPNPILVSATAVSNGITVKWKAVDGISQYRILRKENGGSWAILATASGTSYTDTKAVAGTTYAYSVRCLSGSSYVSSYDTKGLTATRVSKSAELVSATANVITITVTWKAVDGISTYRVLRKTAGTDWTTLADVTGTSYTDPVTRKDVEYTYTVQCLDGTTVTGSYDTKGLTATRTGGYDYPNPILVSAEAVSNGITVTWKAVDGISQYRILRKENGGSWAILATASGTSYTDKKAVAGTTYAYSVRCLSGSSYVSSYDTKGLTATRVSKTAELVSATANVIAITVTWKAVDGISTYRVLRKTADTSWTTLADVSGTSYTDPATRKDVEYTYTVQCLDGITVTGSYDAKGVTATRTGGYDYPNPILVSATAVSNGITVKWKAVDGISQYRILRKETGGSWAILATASGTSYTDKKAVEGTKYAYSVRCLSGSSYVSSYDTKGLTATRVSKSAELVSATANVIAITVTWKAVDGISMYRVLRKTADTDWTALADVTGTSYTDPVTRKDVEYTYTVQCLDGSTVTGSYDTKGITATRTGGYDYPNPILVSATAVSTGITVKWKAVDGISQYRILRKETGGSWAILATASGTSYTDKKAVAGTKYMYSVRCLSGSSYVSSYDTKGVTATR